MKKMLRYALVVLLFLTCQSCGDRGDKGGTESKPAVKADTLAFTFKRFVTSPDAAGRAAEFTVANGFSKGITAVKLTLLYQNAAGETIRPFQWSISELPVWLAPGAAKTTVAGHGIPEDVKTVAVVVREITFEDGKSVLVENK